jgi:isopenicillin N synthase-like dioxygenase
MSPASATAAAKVPFPIVDFSPFYSGDPGEKRRVADSMVDACKGAGFFYLAGHGITQSQLDGIFAAAQRFFNSPLEERMKLAGPGLRGYRPYGFYAKANPNRVPDLMEQYLYQRDLPADDPDILAGDHLHGLNKWPDNLPGWREDLLGYFHAVENLSFAMLRAFAIGLDVEEEHFLQFFRKPTSSIKLFHYPPQSPESLARQVGLGSHFDDTAVTILLQDEVGGLQVEDPRGWIDVTPIRGTFVINIGEVMARWTNDVFLPTPHRVINRFGRERYSVPFFALPDWDAIIVPVASCCGPENPQKYPPRRAAFFQSRAFRDANWKARHAAYRRVVERSAAQAVGRQPPRS